MPRYAAFLRGVSPMNCKMPDLKKCLEEAGYSNVKTVLASGNVVFDAKATSETALERKLESILKKGLGREFPVYIRSVEALQGMLAENPFSKYKLKSGTKCVVTFMRESPKTKPKLPIERDGARLLHISGKELFSAYVPSPKDPVFMQLIEKTLGKDVTTRAWDTIQKVARA